MLRLDEFIAVIDTSTMVDSSIVDLGEQIFTDKMALMGCLNPLT